jgi:hypothetical protein
MGFIDLSIEKYLRNFYLKAEFLCCHSDLNSVNHPFQGICLASAGWTLQYPEGQKPGSNLKVTRKIRCANHPKLVPFRMIDVVNL